MRDTLGAFYRKRKFNHGNTNTCIKEESVAMEFCLLITNKFTHEDVKVLSNTETAVHVIWISSIKPSV